MPLACVPMIMSEGCDPSYAHCVYANCVCQGVLNGALL